MKLTKFAHACMLLEKNGQKLLIDPGEYTPPIGEIADVVGIVVTHEHADHWTAEQINPILAANPAARILATPVTAKNMAAAGITVAAEAVVPGDALMLGEFKLHFFGGKHAIIHESIPQIDNVAVLVDDTFYYAGDSFFVPPVPVELLAAPASAPWMKLSETMDYIMAVKAPRVIQAHEMVNSDIGNGMAKARMTWATEQVGGVFTWLAPGDTFEV